MCSNKGHDFTLFQSGLCPVLWACSESAEVSAQAEANVSIMLLNSVLHRSSSLSYVYLATFTGNPVNYTVLFSRVNSG